MDTGKDGLSLTQGVMLYVHLECLTAFLARIEQERATIQPDRLRFWKPEELIGRYKDITRCDQCGKAFAPTDRGYLGCWAVSLEQLAVWLSAQGREATTPPPAQGVGVSSPNDAVQAPGRVESMPRNAVSRPGRLQRIL